MSESGSRKLPHSWLRVELAHVVQVHYGKALAAKDREASGHLPVIGSSGVVGLHDQSLVEGPCVVVGRKGAAGAVHYVSKSCWPIDTAYSIQPPIGLSLKFLFYMLGSFNLVELDKSTAIPSLSRDDLHRVSIALPPAAEQTRIVDKLEELLSDLDAGVAELKAAQKKLAQYRQSLLKAAVEGRLTEAWRAQHGEPEESGAQLLARILRERRARWEARQLATFEAQGKAPPNSWQDKYRKPVAPSTEGLPALPCGWVWASLDMLGDIASGVAKGTKRDERIAVREVSYLRVANVQRGYLDLSEVKAILANERDIAELTLHNGDVLFNEGGDRDKLGRGWVWRNQVETCIHQNHVFRMRPILPELRPELISHHGNTFGKLWFQSAGKQTTNLASINMGLLREFPVPLAPAAEQTEILSQLGLQLTAVADQVASTELALRRSTAQRKNILQAAFSGQLVPQDPNDEPASVLLARIRAERAGRIGAATKRGRKAKALS